MKPITDLVDLLINELKVLHAIEKEELNEMYQFILKIKNDELKQILTLNKEQTKNQILRLEESLYLLGESPTKTESKILKPYFEQTKNVLQIVTELSVIEARIILCFQTIAHIEIASYGTLLAYAKILDIKEVASLLEKSLAEEKLIDLKLTILAEYEINEGARIEAFIPLS